MAIRRVLLAFPGASRLLAPTGEFGNKRCSDPLADFEPSVDAFLTILIDHEAIGCLGQKALVGPPAHRHGSALGEEKRFADDIVPVALAISFGHEGASTDSFAHARGREELPFL